MPTSTNAAPLCSITSGIRNLPPISTSSPRDTTTSPPFARELKISITAAALLLTAIAASAPVSLHRSFSKWEYLSPLLPSSRLYSRFEYPVASAAIRSMCSRAMGARPRFVCSTVPVPFTTIRILGVCIAATVISIWLFSIAICAIASSSSPLFPINARSLSISI